MSIVIILFSLLPFYALGAFPTGVIISKLHGINISAHGSGNVGATNVARVIGKRAGIMTLIGDVSKGALGVWIAGMLVSEAWYPALAGIGLVMGHCCSIPPFLRGGKGVATALGVISVLHPSSSLVAILVFASFFGIWRIVSLASIAAALVVPAWALIMNAPESVCVSLIGIACIVVMRHEQNLRRLIEGREPKFSSKQTDSDPAPQ